MPRERLDPKTGEWVPHKKIIEDLQKKKEEHGALSPTDEAALNELQLSQKSIEDKEEEVRASRKGNGIVKP